MMMAACTVHLHCLLCFIGRGKSRTIQYHVVYFGDKKLTGWISELHCVPFEGLSSFPQLESRAGEPISRHSNRHSCLVSKRFQKAWNAAVVDAETSWRVRRSSRLRKHCMYGGSVDVQASGLQQLLHDDLLEVSGHGASVAKQMEKKVSAVSGRKRCRSDSAATRRSVVAAEKQCYENTSSVGHCDIKPAELTLVNVDCDVVDRSQQARCTSSVSGDRDVAKKRHSLVCGSDHTTALRKRSLSSPDNRETSSKKRRVSVAGGILHTLVDNADVSMQESGSESLRQSVCCVCEKVCGVEEMVKCRGECTNLFHLSCTCSSEHLLCQECTTG